jgi:hypothetical protein
MSMHGSENEHELTDGYILIQAQPGNEVSALAELVTQIPGVLKAERVHGAYDVIAEVRERHEQPRVSRAAHAIRELDGVLRAIPLATQSRLGLSAGSEGEAA